MKPTNIKIIINIKKSVYCLIIRFLFFFTTVTKSVRCFSYSRNSIKNCIKFLNIYWLKYIDVCVFNVIMFIFSYKHFSLPIQSTISKFTAHLYTSTQWAPTNSPTITACTTLIIKKRWYMDDNNNNRSYFNF